MLATQQWKTKRASKKYTKLLKSHNNMLLIKKQYNHHLSLHFNKKIPYKQDLMGNKIYKTQKITTETIQMVLLQAKPNQQMLIHKFNLL